VPVDCGAKAIRSPGMSRRNGRARGQAPDVAAGGSATPAGEPYAALAVLFE
jgi:hypothetical protein